MGIVCGRSSRRIADRIMRLLCLNVYTSANTAELHLRSAHKVFEQHIGEKIVYTSKVFRRPASNKAVVLVDVVVVERSTFDERFCPECDQSSSTRHRHRRLQQQRRRQRRSKSAPPTTKKTSGGAGCLSPRCACACMCASSRQLFRRRLRRRCRRRIPHNSEHRRRCR